MLTFWGAGDPAQVSCLLGKHSTKCQAFKSHWKRKKLRFINPNLLGPGKSLNSYLECLKSTAGSKEEFIHTSKCKGPSINFNKNKRQISAFDLFFFEILGIELRASCMIGKHSTTELYPDPYFSFLPVMQSGKNFFFLKNERACS